MVIYHLVVDVHTKRYGELCEADCYFTDVFPTLDLAVEKGKQEVKERIVRLLKQDPGYNEKNLDEFIEEKINYRFVVYEFDPVRRNNECRRKDRENITLENSVEFSDTIWWEYDDKGELIYRLEERGVIILPSDYHEDAGTHFKVGDLVTIKEGFGKEDNSSGVYVVAVAPGRRRDAKNPLCWANFYRVHYLYYDYEYHLNCEYDVHESHIEPVTRELSPDSFLLVLSEFFKDESKFSEEFQKRLYSLEPIYTCDLTQHYKFIKGLQPQQSGVE